LTPHALERIAQGFLWPEGDTDFLRAEAFSATYQRLGLATPSSKR